MIQKLERGSMVIEDYESKCLNLDNKIKSIPFFKENPSLLKQKIEKIIEILLEELHRKRKINDQFERIAQSSKEVLDPSKLIITKYNRMIKELLEEYTEFDSEIPIKIINQIKSYPNNEVISLFEDLKAPKLEELIKENKKKESKKEIQNEKLKLNPNIQKIDRENLARKSLPIQNVNTFIKSIQQAKYLNSNKQVALKMNHSQNKNIAKGGKSDYEDGSEEDKDMSFNERDKDIKPRLNYGTNFDEDNALLKILKK